MHPSMVAPCALSGRRLRDGIRPVFFLFTRHTTSRRKARSLRAAASSFSQTQPVHTPAASRAPARNRRARSCNLSIPRREPWHNVWTGRSLRGHIIFCPNASHPFTEPHHRHHGGQGLLPPPPASSEVCTSARIETHLPWFPLLYPSLCGPADPSVPLAGTSIALFGYIAEHYSPSMFEPTRSRHNKKNIVIGFQ